MGFLLQLRLLLWKNFVLRKRQPFRVVVEIVWPLTLFLILVAVRFRPDVRVNIGECHYTARAMPSAGTLAFLSSYVCNFNNDCNNNSASADRFQFNRINGSLLVRVIDDLEILLSNKNSQNLLANLGADVQLLYDLRTAIINGTTDLGNISLKLMNVVVDREGLLNNISKLNIGLTSSAVETLLSVSIDPKKVTSALTDSNRTNLDNLITVVNDLIQLGNNISADNDYASSIFNITCSDKNLWQYLEFKNKTDADSLYEQLCSLSPENVTALAEILNGAINRTEVMSELQDIMRNVTGRIPSLNLDTIVGFITDLNELSSFGYLLSDLSAATDQTVMASSNFSLTNGSIQDILGRFICGGGKKILSQDDPKKLNDTSQKKESDTQKTKREIGLKVVQKNYESAGISPECAGFLASIETDANFKVIWNQIKPIALGVITYTPDTIATRKIIKEASRTFDNIESMLNLTSDLEAILPQIGKFLKEDIEPIRMFVGSQTCKNVVHTLKQLVKYNNIPSVLPPYFPPSLFETFNESICDTAANFLATNGLNYTYDWTDAFNNTYELLRQINPYLKCFRLDKFVGYPDTRSLEEASLLHIANKTFWAAIVFENVDKNSEKIPSMVKYKIRMDTDNVDGTKKIMDKYWRPGNRAGLIDLKYWIYGFIYIQDMIDHAIIRLHTNVTQEPGVYTKQTPYGCYIYDKFVFAISRSLPLFMVIAWIYTVAMIIKGVVYEKEKRLKEVMKIMGLSNGVHWLAWFITSFVMMLITVILFVIVLKAGKILEYSDPSVILVFMIGFTCSTISQCFLISVFFNKANLAAVCGGFIYFVLYLPYTQLVQFEDVITTSERILASLSSNIAMGYACSYFSQYEEQAIGAQWHNIRESPMVDDTFNLKTCIGMLYLDSVIYLFLTWYIEAVFPGEYGIPRKWYFLIQKSYWLGTKGNIAPRVDAEISVEDIGNSNDNFEKDPTGRPIGVAVKNLRKIYNKGDKIAVDGLTLNFYEGQITSFLGHNGAGKTTTMSILTGLFPPTSGTAYIYGHNILTDLDEIRSGLGMCPQHNVLFDLLTVEEHIWFYARLKGRSAIEVKKETEEMIKDVGLPNKRKEKAENLSGGMKRKLSVAIAFVGGSKTVILDEPTAGVDPYARRAIWELLLKFRKGRTIILSTHHMDEADVLGDRIAIISQGKLCTVGTSLFLKNKFGSGYYLTLVRQEVDAIPPNGSSRPSTATSIRTVVDVQPIMLTEEDDEGYDALDSSSDDVPIPLPPLKSKTMVPGFNLPRLIVYVQRFVPGAVLVEDNSMEVCFRLPEGEDHARKFQELFAALELSHQELGISSYGISDTSLEEVFLKVAEENGDGVDSNETSRSKLTEMKEDGRYPKPTIRSRLKGKLQTSVFQLNYRNRVNSTERLTADVDDEESLAQDVVETFSDVNFSGAGEVKVTGQKLILRQMIALFLKRLHHVRRSKKGFISEIILPAAFVCLAMVFSLILPSFSEQPPLELQPWMYEPKKGDNFLYTFYSNEEPNNPLTSELEYNLLHEPFYGTRCMNSSIYTISGKSCLQASKMEWTAKQSPANTNDSPTCSCETGFQICPEGAGGPEPPKIKLWTNDRLYNTTNRNLSDWLVKTYSKYQKRRYGGYSFGDANAVKPLGAGQISTAINNLIRTANNNRSIFFGNIQLLEDLENSLINAFVPDTTTVWFNNKGWAASVSYMNALNNLLLRTLLPDSQDPKEYGIVTINHPMNLTKEQFNEETLYNSAVNVVVAICVIFAMSFVPASFVLFLIEERVSNSKHLQFVSGIKPTVYWLANWAWDMINYAIPALLCVFIFLAFGKDAYVSAKNLPCLFALLFLYGWAITPMMYPFSRLFDVPSSAFVALSCVNVFLGTVSTLATFILELLSRDDPDLGDINNILKQVFLLLPHYCLGRGLIDMASYQLQADVSERFGKPLVYSLFEWKIVGRNLFALVFLGFFFNLLNWLIEYKFFISWKFLSKQPALKTRYEDVDVAREKQRVLSGGAVNDVLRLEGLTKVYWKPGKKGKMTAVDHLYVGVPKGQCFGLLGVNGAGKTTTFKMLTGDESLTSGDAFINAHSVSQDMVKVRQFMGYCPQFDALDPLLTGREHLEFYARVRGISSTNVKTVADWAIKRLGLVRHADKISSSYSGGNKRKLSTAIALIGNPPIIFLDEPTTGMDPGARRFLWNCINNIVKSGRSVILTSHSMEECEALCNRLAIMVNGTFQCLGSIQHLKNRFGNGYTIILRVSGENPDVNSIMQFISSNFPSAKLREKHHNMLQYQLGTESLSLSKLFEAMERAKQENMVEDYSVSQTTLDQVFINFARKQTDLTDEELTENKIKDVDDLSSDSEGDNLSSIFNTDSVSTGLPSEFDEESLSGSTAALVKPESARSSATNLNRMAVHNTGISNISIS
ncbi:phospholipid-transporting ATPase ABCA1-like [Physella acuta]|uniref:phospholipid-transporting ATPase ABCA1-like n=1 Tax=Physella acuta TaxID=109671 RepID=UPI0027DBD8D8|nr:phospholipid-transporting ATPase ABCA1-like [Physella acuta]